MDHLSPHLFHGVADERRLRTAIGTAEFERLCGAGLLIAQPGHLVSCPDAADQWTPLAAIQLRHRSVVGAGRSACWAQGIQPFVGRACVFSDLISPTRSREPTARVRPDLVGADVVQMAGLWFTSPIRTIADLGDFVDDDTVERAVESVLRRPEIREGDVWAMADRLRRPGRHGPAVLGRVLERRGKGTPATESDLETRALQLIRRMGFPEPTSRQYPVKRPNGNPYRVDYAWDNGRYLVFVEIDGTGVHANPDALTADLTRQNVLGRGRPVLLRFTSDHIDYDHGHVETELSQHLYRTGSITRAAPARTAPSNPRAAGRSSAA